MTFLLQKWIMDNDCTFSWNAHTVLLINQVNITFSNGTKINAASSANGRSTSDPFSVLFIKPVKVVPKETPGNPVVMLGETKLIRFSCIAPYSPGFGHIMHVPKYYQPDTKSLLIEDLQNPEHLSDLTFSAYGNPITWDDSVIYNFHNVPSGDRVNFCEHNVSAQLPRFSAEEKMIHAHQHLWIDILSNYTMVAKSPPFISCIDGRPDYNTFLSYHSVPHYKLHLETTKTINDDAPFSLLFRTRVPLASIRFVSCGKRGFKPLPFQELLNVFELPVWILIVIVAICFPITFRYLSKRKSRRGGPLNFKFTYVFSVFKILLEQGDDLISSAINSWRWKIFVGIWALLAVVLSNAYKSTNVYNMISEKVLVPYEWFPELLEENFKIYAKLSKVHLQLPGRFNPEGLSLYPYPHEIRDLNPNKFHSPSHIDELIKKDGNLTNLAKLIFVKQHSRLYPNLEQMLKPLISQAYSRGIKSILEQEGADKISCDIFAESECWEISDHVSLRKGNLIQLKQSKLFKYIYCKIEYLYRFELIW